LIPFPLTKYDNALPLFGTAEEYAVKKYASDSEADSETEQSELKEFKNKDIEGCLRIRKDGDSFSLSGYFSLNQDNKVLILILPDDSNIILDPEKPRHVFVNQKIISLDVEIYRGNRSFEFEGIVFSAKPDLKGIRYEIADSYSYEAAL
jgi:hypothetical protein